MRKTMSRLFMAVLMVALLVGASIISVSAADGPTCDGSHDGWTAITEGGTYTPTQDTNYYLDADLTSGITFQTAAGINIKLCLNGHKIEAADHALYVDGPTLDVVNCGDASTVKVTGSYALLAGMTAAGGKTTTVNIGKNITLEGASRTIAAQHNAVVNLNGCTVKGEGEEDGAAVYFWTATINMYDGTTITGKTTTQGGGVYSASAGTFNMYGGTITGCSAAYGGGVYVNKGTFKLIDGTITNNTATTSNGGQIYVAKDGNLQMTKGTIGTCSGNAVYLIGTTTSRLSGGTVNCKIIGTVAGRTIELSGDITVTGDVSAYNNTINISGGKFSGTVAQSASNPGVIVISGGQFSKAPAEAMLETGYVLAEIEDGDYNYKVQTDGFTSSGEYMDFGSALGLGLYLDKSAVGYEVSVTGGYTVDTTTHSDINVIIANGIAAKDMDEDITFEIKDDTTTLFKKTLSIRDAAETWYADDATKTLAADMINYGIEAQKTFEGKASMETLGATETVPTDWNAAEGAGVPEEYKSIVAVTLNLKDQIELNIYVRDEKATSDDVDAAYVTNAAGETITRFTFDDIAVKDVKTAKTFTVELSNGETFEVKYGIVDYVLQATGDPTNNQNELLVALQKYVDSVINYTNNH